MGDNVDIAFVTSDFETFTHATVTLDQFTCGQILIATSTAHVETIGRTGIVQCAQSAKRDQGRVNFDKGRIQQVVPQRNL